MNLDQIPNNLHICSSFNNTAPKCAQFLQKLIYLQKIETTINRADDLI